MAGDPYFLHPDLSRTGLEIDNTANSPVGMVT
jgi:hypothetical protein